MSKKTDGKNPAVLARISSTAREHVHTASSGGLYNLTTNTTRFLDALRRSEGPEASSLCAGYRDTIEHLHWAWTIDPKPTLEQWTKDLINALSSGFYFVVTSEFSDTQEWVVG